MLRTCNVISVYLCVVLTLPVTLIAISVMYLHSKGIAHSDLKAANILVDGNGAARVADFGVRLFLSAPSKTFPNR